MSEQPTPAERFDPETPEAPPTGAEPRADMRADGPMGAPAELAVTDPAADPCAAIDALRRENEELRTSLAAARSRLAYFERLADRDSLVPAYNRRAFMRELRRTISYGARYGTVNSVLYFDVNGMKGINDTLGHAAGDAALTRIAQVLDANVRDSDTVGRLGGDEFGVILVNADRDRADRKAVALALAISSTSLKWEGWSIPLETAHGTHTIAPGDTAHSALYAADQSMYLHKEAIRARRRADRARAARSG